MYFINLNKDLLDYSSTYSLISQVKCMLDIGLLRDKDSDSTYLCDCGEDLMSPM